jgi:hypothetical protein
LHPKLQNKKKRAPWELNFGQSIWDKTEGTFWELEGNKPGRRGKKAKNPSHPIPERNDCGQKTVYPRVLDLSEP